MSGINVFSLPGDSVNNKSKDKEYSSYQPEYINYVLWSQFNSSVGKQEPSAPKERS